MSETDPCGTPNKIYLDYNESPDTEVFDDNVVCPSCGQESSNNFCPFCGSKLEHAPKIQYYHPPRESYHYSHRRNKRGFWFWVIYLITLGSVVIMAIYMVLYMNTFTLSAPLR